VRSLKSFQRTRWLPRNDPLPRHRPPSLSGGRIEIHRIFMGEPGNERETEGQEAKDGGRREDGRGNSRQCSRSWCENSVAGSRRGEPAHRRGCDLSPHSTRAAKGAEGGYTATLAVPRPTPKLAQAATIIS
jgi:hypothetical protein